MVDWRSSEYLRRLLTPTPGLEHDLRFFRQVDWVDRDWLKNPHYRLIRNLSRGFRDGAEDRLIGKTLQTDDTATHWLTLVRNDVVNREDAKTDPTVLTMPALVNFLNLEIGLCGYKDTLHGGMTCTLLDESMGSCVELHRQSDTSLQEKTEIYTAYLNVTYKSPVRLPGTFMSKCWLQGREGRKWWVRGQLCDSQGQVCAEAEGLWVSARSKKL